MGTDCSKGIAKRQIGTNRGAESFQFTCSVRNAFLIGTEVGIFTSTDEDSGDIIIGYEQAQSYLRLTPKAAEYFPEWIEDNHMDGLDAESYLGLRIAQDKDND